ncbi:MAG TPA: hypothetical protein ENI23_17460 [bacterium]|nr:hypothetical protein [bacterium]
MRHFNEPKSNSLLPLEIAVDLCSISTMYLEDSLKGIISKLEEMKKKYRSLGYSKLRINYSTLWGSLRLTGQRVETADEVKNRLERCQRSQELYARQRAIARENRKRQYEKLREEFEPQE